MYAQHSKKPKAEQHTRLRIRDIVADAIGAISIFAIGYTLLLLGHSLGLN